MGLNLDILDGYLLLERPGRMRGWGESAVGRGGGEQHRFSLHPHPLSSSPPQIFTTRISVSS